jgi:hypothetical protein
VLGSGIELSRIICILLRRFIVVCIYCTLNHVKRNSVGKVWISIVFDGMFLGLMSFVGLSVVYNRLPGSVKMFAIKHPLFTDVVCAVFFYQVFGLTLTAHFAVIAQSLMVTTGLHIVKHKEDFQFLYDLADVAWAKITEGLDMLKRACSQLNAANKAAKLNSMNVIDVG